MSVFKRGGVYWYEFVFEGQRVRRSTKQGSRVAARDMEADYRTKLAKGEVGMDEPRKREPVPTLADFLTNRFLPWVKATCSGKIQTRNYYRQGARTLSEFRPIASMKLDQITSEHVSRFVAARQADKLMVSSINRELQVLRRALRIAVEWGVVPTVLKVKMLRGEHQRERVISAVEESLYLAAAPEPLVSIATTLFDSGLRPEEAFRMEWSLVNFEAGRHGSIRVTHGKTAAARRTLPITLRVRKVLHSRWEAAGKPAEGFVWPAATQSGHAEPSTIRKQHAGTFKVINEQLAERKEKAIVPFLLYDARHTFLTRLGASGCDAWTLARIAGHSSINMSKRYVHPDDTSVIERLEAANARQAEIASAGNVKLLN